MGFSSQAMLVRNRTLFSFELKANSMFVVHRLFLHGKANILNNNLKTVNLAKEENMFVWARTVLF